MVSSSLFLQIGISESEAIIQALLAQIELCICGAVMERKKVNNHKGEGETFLSNKRYECR